MKYVYVLCLITLCVASVIGMAYPRAVDGGNGTPLKAAFGPLQKAESASRVKREANEDGIPNVFKAKFDGVAMHKLDFQIRALPSIIKRKWNGIFGNIANNNICLSLFYIKL